jgi:hypothetical protein
MSGTGLYIAGSTAGLGAYVVGRAVLRFRDFHRAAIRGERNVNVVRLLQPYERTATLHVDSMQDRTLDGSPRVQHLRSVGTELEAG